MHVELCAGIGGLALGLGGADEFWEIDPAPSEVLAQRFGDVPNRGDWTELDRFDDAVTVVSGGLPCQPVSGAGRGRGDADERYLYDELVRVLRSGDVRPVLLLENVRGILYPRNAEAFWRFISALADLGYVGRWEVVRASDVGAPHRRERWFCTARHPDGASAGRNGGGLPGPQGSARRDGGVGDGPTDAVGVARHPDGVAGPSPIAIRGGDGERQLGQWQGAGAGSGDSATHPDGARLQGRGVEELPGAGERPAGADGLALLRASRYGPAVARWEQLTRLCPAPLDGDRLAPRFVEWMLGFPDGWATDILGRTAALKALGNSVCPQQAALAFDIIGGPRHD